MAGCLSVLGRGHEPMPRIWHMSQQTRNKVLVHGGRTKDYSKDSKQAVYVFDVYTELWQEKKATEKTPAPNYLTASASLGGDLFTFGGWDGSRRNDSLHRLKGGLEWIELSSQNESPESPIAKEGAGMVAFGDNLAVFGGYGRPPGRTQHGSSFVRDSWHRSGEGWTNEFHIYNLENNEWISPDMTGERPPPCDAFSLTSIDNKRAVLFGGGNGEQGRMNDVYIIDLLTMHWTKLNKSGDGPWPEERSYHAACCLNCGQQHPQLLVTGGVNRQGTPLGDAWVLDVDSGRWRKVRRTLRPRWGHSITAFCLVNGVTEVTMFGGSADPWTGSSETQSKLADTTLLQFCQSEWELRSVTPFSKLGSEERVSVKKIQSEWQDGGMGERMQQAEVRADELQRRLEEERRERERLAIQLQEKERMLEQAMEMVQQTEARVQQEREKVQRAEERAQQAEEREQQEREALGQKVRQVEARADELQRRLDKVEGREQVRLRLQQQPMTAEQNADFRQFGKPTMSLLMNLVGCNVKNKWREIGTGLGVTEADLTSIQADEAGKTDSIQHCMQRVFCKWESAMTSEYTWQNLANVLNSPYVNEKAAVLKLHKSLCECIKS